MSEWLKKWRFLGWAFLGLCLAVVMGPVPVGLGQGVPPGFDAASFSRFGLGARALAMAGAYVGVAEGPIAAYWNPAGLALMEDLQVEAMYTNWLGADIHFQYVSAAGHPPLGDGRLALRLCERRITFGAAWLSVHVADIPWAEDGDTGVFSAWSHEGILSVGIPLQGALNLGVSAKVYHDRILEGRSFGVGLDTGLLWTTSVGDVRVRVGLSTTDVGGSRIQWYGTTGEPVNHVPWLARVGASVLFGSEHIAVLGAASYEWGLDRPRFGRLRVGAEISLSWLAVRAGWDQPLVGDPGRWTVGLGISLAPWGTVEYAFLPGRLGDTHLLALRITL